MDFIDFNYQKKTEKKILFELKKNFKKNDFILGKNVEVFEK